VGVLPFLELHQHFAGVEGAAAFQGGQHVPGQVKTASHQHRTARAGQPQRQLKGFYGIVRHHGFTAVRRG
jgi:hypothetical protein